MIKTENYPNAYKEVYEILKFVPQEDKNRIPHNFMEMIKKNMNKEYEFSIDKNIDFIEEQELMVETRNILAYIFLNYWATEKQKETINIKFKRDIEEAERKKRELYNVDLFKNRKSENLKEEEQVKTEIAIVEYKESIFTKIKNWLKNIIRKFN